MTKINNEGIWEVTLFNVNEYSEYKYAIFYRHRWHLKADPYAFHSELRPNTASKVYNLDLGGAVVALFGLLVLVVNLGALDTFGYGFNKMFSRDGGRYQDLVEYETVKKAKRSTKKFIFMPYLLVGLFFILVAGILYIIA